MATYKTTFQFRRGLQSEWELKDPVLAAGEPAYCTDTQLLKIGNGTGKWSELEPVQQNFILISSSSELPPAESAKEVLYIATDTKYAYVVNEDRSGYITIGAASGSEREYRVAKVTDTEYKLQYRDNAGEQWSDVSCDHVDFTEQLAAKASIADINTDNLSQGTQVLYIYGGNATL